MNLFSQFFEDRDQRRWPVSLRVICDHSTQRVQMLMKSVGRGFVRATCVYKSSSGYITNCRMQFWLQNFQNFMTSSDMIRLALHVSVSAVTVREYTLPCRRKAFVFSSCNSSHFFERKYSIHFETSGLYLLLLQLQ
jgi:hypothetical protein